jgi:hypothetical protein
MRCGYINLRTIRNLRQKKIMGKESGRPEHRFKVDINVDC